MKLVYSPDGESWRRIPERPILLPYGNVGEFDSSCAITCQPPVRVGDELWTCFGGTEPTHGWDLDNGIQWKGGRHRHAVGLAKWRLDGFISLAAKGAGSFTTRPLVFQGKNLFVSLRSPIGFIKIRLLDENGKAIDGLTSREADELMGDSIAQMVSWNGDGDVSAHAGKPIRLRFEMMHAAVFGFQFQ